MLNKREFPNWQPPSEFSAKGPPAGFTDSSWHNDSCPSWTNERLNLKLWVQDGRPREREFWPRCHDTTFSLSFDIEEPENGLPEILTDDLEVIEVAVRKVHERLVERLAIAFSLRIRRDLADNLQRVIELNRIELDTNCASHDFIDSNVTMQEAWQSIPALGDNEVDCQYCADIWNAAWQLAKENDFVLTLKEDNSCT